MNKTILIQGAGSGGGNNLIDSLNRTNLSLKIIGTNCSEKAVAKSDADKTYLIPSSSEKDKYVKALNDIINDENVDLMFPTNGSEVYSVSKLRNEFNAEVFLPDHKVIKKCQDKQLLQKQLLKNNIPTASPFKLDSFKDIQKAFENLPDDNKYWVRTRKGSGSKGATWVENYQQAEKWISLWTELRDYKISDFHILPFLPGRDYACQSIWKDGKLLIAKMCERLSYVGGANRLSGMSSSPSFAKTVSDSQAFETLCKAVNTVSQNPHGTFSMDMKADSEGKMHITEFNIGRFCMITPIFDQTGQYNTAEIYVKASLEKASDLPKGKYDIEKDMYLLRELDTKPTVISKDELRNRLRNRKFVSISEF